MSVEVLGSKFGDVGRFACGESSSDFLAVGRLGDSMSSPYPVYHHNQ